MTYDDIHVLANQKGEVVIIFDVKERTYEFKMTEKEAAEFALNFYKILRQAKEIKRR